MTVLRPEGATLAVPRLWRSSYEQRLSFCKAGEGEHPFSPITEVLRLYAMAQSGAAMWHRLQPVLAISTHRTEVCAAFSSHY